MHRTTVVTAAASTGLIAAAALLVAAPALAQNVARAAGDVTRYPNQTINGSFAPEGASARVQSVETGDGRTIVTLNVSRMKPFATYGAHAHVRPCGNPDSDPKGLAAGPHFQNVPDPVAPSVDPAFANPENEIWLDLSTNRAGEGRAKAVVDWQFAPARRAQSVIIHERQTSTAPGKHGTAGARVACLNVPF